MFLEHPKKPSDAVDKLVIQVIVDICDSIVEEHNLNIGTCTVKLTHPKYFVLVILGTNRISNFASNCPYCPIM